MSVGKDDKDEDQKRYDRHCNAEQSKEANPRGSQRGGACNVFNKEGLWTRKKKSEGQGARAPELNPKSREASTSTGYP